MAGAGFDPVYGARPLRRSIQTQVEDLLSEKLLEGALRPGEAYVCRADEGEMKVEKAEGA